MRRDRVPLLFADSLRAPIPRISERGWRSEVSSSNRPSPRKARPCKERLCKIQRFQVPSFASHLAPLVHNPVPKLGGQRCCRGGSVLCSEPLSVHPEPFQQERPRAACLKAGTSKHGRRGGSEMIGSVHPPPPPQPPAPAGICSLCLSALLLGLDLGDGFRDK